MAATRRQKLVEEAWVQCGLLVHQTLIWVKARGVLTRSHYLWSYEPFSGSGTQIIAAERAGRLCYAMEMEPRYCDVAKARSESFSGQSATRA